MVAGSLNEGSQRRHRACWMGGTEWPGCWPSAVPRPRIVCPFLDGISLLIFAHARVPARRLSPAGRGAWMPWFFEAQEYRAIAAVRPRLLTVRKPRRRDHARLGTQRRATPGEAGETGYPQKPVFASADAMQRYRCVPDPTWPQLSRLSRHGRGHAVEDNSVDGKEICC